jgi:hypothetical protein
LALTFRQAPAMTKQLTCVAQGGEDRSYERTMHLVPSHVYDQIIEACRPFYAMEQGTQQQAGQGTLVSSSALKLPMRFEDSVELSRAQNNDPVRRLVSPTPEVRGRRSWSRNSQLTVSRSHSSVEFFPGKLYQLVIRSQMTIELSSNFVIRRQRSGMKR